MPSFNLNKRAQAKVYDKMLGDQQSEIGTSIEGTTETVQGLLSDSRGEGQGANLDVVTETQMDEPHKKASDVDQLTEGQLSSAKGSYQTHRDNQADDAIMKPNDALAEALHQKHRDAYAAENEPDEETKFWDDFVGDQMEGDIHKVIASDPPEASQLSNHPERFDNIKSASLAEVDADIFALFYKAASEERELSDLEQEALDVLSSIKAGILTELKGLAENN